MAVRFAPRAGLATWPAPDATAPNGPTIAGGLEVDVLEQQASGWAYVRCSNGWEAWVDGRLLVDAAPAAAASKRGLLIGGAIAAAVLLIAVVSGRGGGGDGNGLAGGGSGSGAETFAGERIVYDEGDDERALAKANALPDSEVTIAEDDEIAAEAIKQAFLANGYDLGVDTYVLPLSGDSNMLFIGLTDDHPLNRLPEDKASAFLKDLVTSPVVTDENHVRRVVLEYKGSDDEGAFTLTMTGSVADIKQMLEQQGQEEDPALAKRIGFGITRP